MKTGSYPQTSKINALKTHISTTITAIAMVIVIISMSCSGSEKKNGYANSVFVSGNDVYIAGFKYQGDKGNKAMLWKNGVGSVLHGQKKNVHANHVFVSGNDVYVVGSENDTTPGEIGTILWKNGVSQSIDSKEFAITGNLFVSGVDVYVTGQGRTGMMAPGSQREITPAAIWKNGEVQHLDFSDEGFYTAMATAIFVSGDDVYVLGVQQDYYHWYGVLWKNGVPQPLVDINSKAYSGSALFVSDGDVWIAGIDNNYAMLWKNGIPQRLGNTYGSRASSLFVYGSDVYVAGAEFDKQRDIAALWKNGELQPLDDNVNLGSYADSVFVSGSTVYVAGVQQNYNQGRAFATLWKNGVAQILPQ